MKIDVEVINDSGYKSISRKIVQDSATRALLSEKVDTAIISIIFVDDDKILELNKSFLNHDFVTDVITFPLEESGIIEGEIYISVDTARRQAEEYGVSLTNELQRLAVHGVLHLVGYDDDTDEKRDKMHVLEDKYIN